MEANDVVKFVSTLVEKGPIADFISGLSKKNVAVTKVHPDAVMPSRAHSSDIGYDLTIVSHVQQFAPGLDMYDTGLIVVPPSGYYFEIVPRSSFSKSGYVLANSIGIIDPEYRGTLRVVVARVNSETPPLALPYRGFQLVLRTIPRLNLTFVEDVVDTNTERGDGGFGST